MNRWLAILVWLAGCSGACPRHSLCSVMGNGELGFNGDGLPADETRLASPTSVAIDPDGNAVVLDYSNMRLRTQREKTVTTVVGNGTHAYSQIGASVLDTPLENPVDAAWHPNGALYVLPQHEGRVIMVTPQDTIAPCIGEGILGDDGDGGPAVDARMGYGGGLAIADDGTVYISDSSFGRVRRVHPDGTIDTVMGTGSSALGAPGYGPEVALDAPERLVVDEVRRRLLVADTGNHRVLAMDLDDLQVTLIAGTGVAGFEGEGGPGAEAQLDNPVGLEVTEAGHVLIGDLGNRVIRSVAPDGTLSTVAGGGDPDLDTYPGRPDEIPLRGPAGMAWGPDGDLFIADRSGHRLIRWRGVEDAL